MLGLPVKRGTSLLLYSVQRGTVLQRLSVKRYISCCGFQLKEEQPCCGFQLKGHGNEADFLRFLQKLVPHRSLTLLFEPFRFWLRIRGDIRNRKTTPRLGKPGSRYGVAIRIFIIKIQHFERLNQHFKGPI
jgi:hypothetical protein